MDHILKAVSIINEKNVHALIHCGDFVAPFVKKWFDHLNDSIKNRFFGVFGNNDGDRLFLMQNLGQICKFAQNGNELILELGGKRIFIPYAKTGDNKSVSRFWGVRYYFVWTYSCFKK